ncbi:hypothetical protein PAK_P30070 [Pseudomonas phage PAK_P3]|uniref:Uncharacterized protein n=2 Tax=Nankokuvirus PAKP3 TaxID=1925782 RepID=V5K3C5_9CAUD|nr:hypothetical protein PAK_P30070 [Pseudomonas phage PAK_P3]AGS81700.1 hypothetical protein P3_CHA0070 [Pseudomonas phage P3_CHA]AGS81819.1 hypothetical protein PAK_P30070 [Pseudomonas phage PAK_P3]
MASLFILRIETVCGKGMYADALSSKVQSKTLEGLGYPRWQATGLYIDLCMCLDKEKELHPVPEEDIPGWEDLAKDEKEMLTYYFGFSSWEQAREWVGLRAFNEMGMLGANLCIYEMKEEDVLLGGKQAAFKMANALRVLKMPINKGMQDLIWEEIEGYDD